MLTLILSGLAMGCVYGMIAIGFSMIFRTIGLVNFAQGDLVMCGAFIGYTVFLVAPPFPFLLVVIIAMVLTAGLGLLVERLFLRPALRRNASMVDLVLLTLGVGIVLSNVARLVWGAHPVVYRIPLAHEVIRIGDYPLPKVYPTIILFMLLLLVGLYYFLSKSWIGIGLRAAAQDRATAELMGVDANVASALSVAIAAGIGGGAGVLLAPTTYVSFDMGIIGIKGFAAAVLGGFGSIPGAAVGGLALGMIEMIGIQIASEYQESIAFGSMILVLLLRPTGLLGRGAS